MADGGRVAVVRRQGHLPLALLAAPRARRPLVRHPEAVDRPSERQAPVHPVAEAQDRDVAVAPGDGEAAVA